MGRKKSPKLPETTVEQQSDESDDEEPSGLAAMLSSAMEKQRVFIESQFSGLNGTLDEIKKDLAGCTAEVSKLRTEHNALSKKVDKTEKVTSFLKTRLASYEDKLADLEDRNRRDNVRILGVPEGMEGASATEFISTNLPKWFPNIGAQQMEIMRAHRIGPPASENKRPRTLICKMLRFTDRDKILQASRKNPVKLRDREIRFSADFSNYTVARRRAFTPAMEEARKQEFQTFLLYPARLKLIRGQDTHFFDSHAKVEGFLNMRQLTRAEGSEIE